MTAAAVLPGTRLGAAFAASLGAHLLLAWTLGALLDWRGDAPGAGLVAGEAVVRARLQAAGAPAAQAPTPRVPAPAAAGGGARKSSGASRGAPRYRPAAELDARPQITSRVNPEYPKDLVAGIRGRVVLDLYIARNGALDLVQVVRAEPEGMFEESARQAFAGAQFIPGIKNGLPVPSLLRIEVTYGD